MKKLFLCFLILISCTTYASDLPGNPADDTKQQNLDRYKNHLQNQLSYQRSVEEVKASIGKDSSGRDQVKQMLSRSGVLEDGSKVELKTVVTQTPNKTKVAQVLTERLKNAKDYAKNLGKASIPTFVGMAAFQGLMEGIDYVMGEGGEVQKKPDLTGIDPDYTYTYKGNLYQSPMEVCKAAHPNASSISSASRPNMQQVFCYYRQNGGMLSAYTYVTIKPRTPETSPQPTPVTEQELQTALTTALASNNEALKKHIDDAIKAAYSPDTTSGQKPSSNTLAKEAADDMAVALPKAFDNPVPTSNPERPSGYYKITDGDKTVEGYVTPAPIGGTTDTTTTPTIDPVTGQPTGETTTSGGFTWPPFCDYAAVVCDFIDWVREEPEIDEPEVPFKDIDRQEIRDDLLTIGGTACPADIHANFSGLPFGISINKTVEMRPYCDVLEPLKYVFSLLTICLCAFMFLRL